MINNMFYFNKRKKQKKKTISDAFWFVGLGFSLLLLLFFCLKYVSLALILFICFFLCAVYVARISCNMQEFLLLEMAFFFIET